MKSKSIGTIILDTVTDDASLKGVAGEETVMFKLPFSSIRGGGGKFPHLK